MNKEELLKKIDFEKNWLYECGIFGSDVDIAFHAIKKKVIEVLEQEPCEDAISRQAVNEIINDTRDCISIEGYWAILERMKKLPPVNPQEPKTWHWIDNQYDKDFSQCSECGSNWEKLIIENCNMDYCPNCGARMDG